MELKKINETLFTQAKELKMCGDVHRHWYGKTLPVDDLANLMYRNLDFCIDNRWPSKGTLKACFSDEERRRNGIVVDDKWSLLNNTFAVVIGNSDAKARYNAFNVSKIYVFDNAKCEITVKGHASLTIHVYDSAFVTVTAQEKAHVLLVRHSKTCSCITAGQITRKESI